MKVDVDQFGALLDVHVGCEGAGAEDLRELNGGGEGEEKEEGGEGEENAKVVTRCMICGCIIMMTGFAGVN